VTNKIQCAEHGERTQAFVCSDLKAGAVARGFNRAEPDSENPYPDAWCDDCEIIRAAHGGWNEETQRLVKIVLLCSGCYETARIRNTHTTVTLDDLANLRWKCHTCQEWHTGPILDLSYDAPHYWGEEHETSSEQANRTFDWSRKQHKSFLNEDYCAINDEDFFVRGLLNLPIIGSAKNFCWGVWGSVSRENFDALLKRDENGETENLPPIFCWLSTQIPDYPETLSLKMYAHVQKPGIRPYFELEPTDHPLAQEYQHGIAPQRVSEITRTRVREIE